MTVFVFSVESLIFLLWQETSDLILVNLDDGSVRSSSSDTVDLPDIPPAAADCFTQGYTSYEHMKAFF